MAAERRSLGMRNAIHLHPHDIRDEGADRVVETILERTGIDMLIAEAVTLEERHPYPRGELPHNPRRKVLISQATLEVPLSAELFAELPIRPVISPEALAGGDCLAQLGAAAARHGVKVVPWLKGLNGAYAGDLEQICVRTLTGELVPTWLCPTRPAAAACVIRLIRGILERHPAPALLLDRLRYPDWSGATVNPERMLTCFCPSCRTKMGEYGIDLDTLERGLRRVLAEIGRDPRAVPALLSQDTLAAEVEKWLRFRCASITKLAMEIRESTRSLNRGAGAAPALWLNLWPPSFSRFLGQDYEALGALCDGAKHFPYHRLGGGADLAGLVAAIAGPSADAGLAEEIFRRLLSLLDLPYGLSLAEFKAAGLPVAFITRETARAVRAFGPGKPIFSGIQIWDTPAEEIESACAAAGAGGAGGMFFYCYGWAPLENLDAVGRITGAFFS